MRRKEITGMLGLTNINDQEFDVFAKIGTEAEDLVLIDNLLTIMRSFNLMNKRKGMKVKLRTMIEEYMNHVTEKTCK